MKMGQNNRVPLGSLPVKLVEIGEKKVKKYNNNNNIGKNNSLHHGNGEA